MPMFFQEKVILMKMEAIHGGDMKIQIMIGQNI
jgi:hypothetical protein